MVEYGITAYWEPMVNLDGGPNLIKAYNELEKDYANQPGFRSGPLWDQQRLNQLFAKADALGITIHTHAIGDAAIKMTVDACEERANKQYPLKSFFDLGIVAAGASDFPVTVPPMPLWGIQTGVTRMNPEGNPSTLQNPSERATIEQMISAYTINGAYQLFKEKEFGSIKVGKSADLVILDQNLLKIDPVKIGKTEVLQTFLKGKTIFESK